MMITKIAYLFYLFTFSFLISSTAHATTIIYQTFYQLVDRSDHVVGGTVDKIKSKKYNDGEVYTVINLEPAFIITSVGRQDTKKTIKIRYNGGVTSFRNKKGKQIGYEAVTTVGTPEFSEGEEVIIFLQGNGVSNMPIYGWGQGVFRVNDCKEIADATNVPVVGLNGADLVFSSSLANRPAAATKSANGNNVRSTKQPKIIDSTGGLDLIEPSYRGASNKGSLKNEPPLHLNSFVSMIQERKAVQESLGAVRTKSTNDLFSLPPVLLKDSGSSRIADLDQRHDSALLPAPRAAKSKNTENDWNENQ